MSKTYTITMQRNNEYELDIVYSKEFSKMSDEDKSVALEDCIRSLQIELLLVTNSPV
jgi:hypothetical protein